MFYYSSDGKTFVSKISALEYKNKTQLPVFYYYYDNEFSKVDWKTEPTESIDALYLEQAKRIRDKYDYLILAYSGGHDSTNILETFHFNGLKFDHIAIVGALSQDPATGSDNNHNGELYYNAFPYIEELGLSNITKVYDYTTMFSNVENFSVYKMGENWVDSLGGLFSPHNWFWKDFERIAVPSNLDSKKVGIIFGKDKPHLLVDNSFRFVDNPAAGYGNVVGAGTNIDRINFYWDPTFPQILVKQLHILKHIKKSASEIRRDWAFGSNPNTSNYIYNLRKPLIYRSPKSRTSILSLRDSYLYDKSNSEVAKLYLAGIENIRRRLNADTLPLIESKRYRIQ